MKATGVVGTGQVDVRMFEPHEFANVIHWHPESVRRAIRQGRIRAKRFGNGWRIPGEEVSRILEAGLPATPAN